MAQHTTQVKITAKDETDKAFNSFKRNAKEGEKAADSFGVSLKSALAVGTGAAVALGAFITSTANSIREMDGLSASAGVTRLRLRAYGAVTKEVGISTDKFADIVKDTNDKLGDFIATGGGGFADFFETVPASVRLTAGELSKLSGPEVLLQVKKSMDAANLSAKEQVFLLESIGNDASRLIPILKGGSEGFEALANKAEKAIIALDKFEAQRIKDAAKEIERATAAVSGSLEKTAAVAAPAAQGFAMYFTGLAKGFSSLFDTPKEDLRDLQKEATKLREMIQAKEASGGSAFALRDVHGEFERVNKQIFKMQKGMGNIDKLMGSAAGKAKKIDSSTSRIKGEITAATKAAELFAEAFADAEKRTTAIQSALKGIQGIRTERTEGDKDASVLGALTAASKARTELRGGNTQKAAELALKAAEELRKVEQEQGKEALGGTFLKNFEKIAQDAANLEKEKAEAIKLEIVIDGEKKEFSFNKEGAKKASDFASKQLADLSAREARRRSQ